jgi:heme A synthase
LLTGAVLFLLILGAWVASTAGGEYNKGCSTGFTSGWPLCQGQWLPSMEQMGELVQMVHRLGALVVGGALMWGSVRMRELARETGRGEVLTRFVEAGTGMWLLNVLIGGVYIITAGAEGFIELLSLLHLIFGVASFLAIMTALLICRVAIMEPFHVEEE